MANQMRNAIERAKAYYIKKLVKLGIYDQSDSKLYQLTLTELAALYKKHTKQ